jgi:hypothetical protein
LRCSICKIRPELRPIVFDEKQRKWLFSVRLEDGAAELAGLIVGRAAPKWFTFAIESLLWGSFTVEKSKLNFRRVRACAVCYRNCATLRL